MSEYAVQPVGTATMSGVFEFKDKDGNVVGTTPFMMAVPLSALQSDTERIDDGKLGE